MVTNTTSWDKIFNGLVDDLFYQDLGDAKAMYTKIFNVARMDKPQIKHLTGVGFDDWKPSGETLVPDYTTNLQGMIKNYVPTVWKSAFNVTRELKDDVDYKEVAEGARELSRTATRTLEKEGAKLLNNATNTTYFTGKDGLALASASHTREDGGTVISNTGTGAFNENNLETALIRFMERVDGRGQLIDFTANQLVVAPALAKEAKILMDSTGRVATGNNDVNPYKGELEVLVYPRLAASQGGSDTAWFVMNSTYNKSGKGLNFFMRVNPEIQTEKDIETGVTKFVGYMRFAEGFTDFRGVEYSTGTA